MAHHGTQIKKEGRKYQFNRKKGGNQQQNNIINSLIRCKSDKAGGNGEDGNRGALFLWEGLEIIKGKTSEGKGGKGNIA